jgi:hypothetical protein
VIKVFISGRLAGTPNDILKSIAEELFKTPITIITYQVPEHFSDVIEVHFHNEEDEAFVKLKYGKIDKLFADILLEHIHNFTRYK